MSAPAPTAAETPRARLAQPIAAVGVWTLATACVGGLVAAAPGPAALIGGLGVFSLAGAAQALWGALARSERGRLAADAARAAERAEGQAALAARGALIRGIGHQLRTPMTALVGSVELIRRRPLPVEARLHVDALEDAAQVLAQVLDDVLAWSDLSTRAVLIRPEPCDLRALCAKAADMWRAQAEAKGLELVVDIADDAPDRVVLDEVRVKQVLGNLLSNAIKFTRHGGVRLCLQTAPGTAAGEVRLAFSVVDTGVGMGAAELAVANAAAGPAPQAGMALGLVISRELAVLMGGRLKARSQLGVGSRVALVLTCPLAPAAVVPAPAQPRAALRVLVVEDNPANRRIASLFLDGVTEELALAADGEEALRILSVQPFDIILMDLHMPRLDGLAATRRLRAGGGLNADTPVIAFTANAGVEDKSAARAAGMNGFVAKPLKPSALLGEIARVLSEDEARTAAA